MNIFDFNAKLIDGEKISLDQFKGKVVLIVNTASKCGFTVQFEGLQKLYEKHMDQFVVLGFPSNQFRGQDPLSNTEIQNFCQLNFGVSFPLFEKVDVRGADAHPLFNFLIKEQPFKGFDLNNELENKFYNLTKQEYPEFLEDDSIKWNFTKFLVSKDGDVIKRYDSWIPPEEIEADIIKLL
ncbi:glutathione peroxidase [Alkalibaculum sp. M08DMB]|uniref:Glutathione peroxidase n=1 Tax=Alkalibaculum sporogenes TaxID=2655001 RepID=A0A6A7KCN0_9FIRM|nr:glutathione peroxidase [Alkalibaculum sporogenes]MPW27278.1 glutathione peroxidase [Alkalibaculum sporogenes]